MNTTQKSKNKLAKDLQTAQRKLEIEKALDRIRQRALAMKTTEDIGPVVVETRAALIALGIKPFRTLIALCDESADNVRSWSAKQSQNFGYNGEYSLLALRKVGSIMYAPKPKHKRCVMTKENKRQLTSEFRKMKKAAQMSGLELPANWLDRMVDDSPIPYYNHRFFFVGGFVLVGMSRELDRNEINIARQITKTFDFAYKRLLDLQAKENRVREAEIEAGLERVRAQALGMQESGEIYGVANVLRQELENLGYKTDRVTIVLPDVKTKTLKGWTAHQAMPQDVNNFEGKGRRLDRRQQWVKRWENKERSWIEKLDHKAMRAIVKDRMPKSGLNFSQVEIKKRLASLPQQLYLLSINFGDGIVQFGTETPFTDTDFKIAARFTDAFAMAYKRFRELEQKEKQNRELTIQNSLERVRSRALGMQESDELTGVATVLRDELENLGHEINGVSLAIIDETSGTVERWFANSMTPKGTGFGPSAVHPLDRRRSHYKNWRAKKQSWISKRDRDNVASLIRNYNEAIGMPETGIAARLENLPLTPYVNFVNFGPGWIGFVTAQPFTDDEMTVTCRFVEVFRGAYARFKELKEKENQNRELTIQNGLERVRSRALGMQESSELSEVTRVLRTELVNLGLPLRTMTLSFPTDDGGSEIWFPPTPTRPVRVFQFGPEVVEPYPSLQAMIHARESGASDFYCELTETEMRHFNEFWVKLNASYGMDLSSVIQDRGINHWFFFSGGTVQLVLDHELMKDRDEDKLTQDEQRIARRFTDVFAFAYARFQELKQKEDQNRELTIQNAIERVRARALGMQESHEISEVAKLNFEEMTNLGYDVWRSDIFFFSIEENYLDFYGCQDPHATDGLTDEVFVHQIYPLNIIRETLDKHRLIQEAWATLERGEPQFSVRMVDDELRSYYSDCLDVMWPNQNKETTLARLPKAITDHRFFFKDPTGTSDGMGCVDFVLKESLDEEGMAVGRRFADAFEFAYSRFRELKQKEEQNRQLRLNVVLERIRAEVSSMTKAGDMGHVLGVMHEGAIEVGLNINHMAFNILNQGKLTEYHLVDEVPGMAPFREAVYGNLNLYEIPKKEMTEAEFEAWKPQDLRVNHRKTQTQLKSIVDTYKGTVSMPESWDRFPRSVMSVPFSHGVISFLALPKDQFTTEYEHQIGKAFAEVMSLGWARFLDFRALEEQNQQLEEQNSALEEANEQIQETTRLKSQFLATMSHELRTPMNAIIGFTRLVLRRAANLEDRQRENLEKVQLSANHLLTLINDILDLSKVEAGHVDLKPTTFHIPSLLQQCCATVGPTLGKRDVELISDIADDVGEAYTDEDRLRQIMINLLSNALKFTDKGEVRVDCKLADGETKGRQMIEIAVHDTGIGIPENKRETIFEEFRQVDGSSTRRHQGTGLGLAITKRLIELMGGNIGVQSEEGKGSVFTVKIPVNYKEEG